MKPDRAPTSIAVLTCLLAGALSTATLHAQAAPAPPSSSPVPAPLSSPVAPVSRPSGTHNNLFLDPAHGGSDDGARIGDRLLERDLTLSLATRIRTQLADQQNLNLIVTRDPISPDSVDPQPGPPALDARAGMANHAHPFACVLLHATAAGSGVHIVTSELPPPDPNLPSTTSGTPWSTAQSNYVRQSLRLANQVGVALRQAGVPVYLTRASVRPLDSLTCPALAIELAPPRPTTNPSTIADPSYQQRVATAIAAALVSWRAHTEPAHTEPPTALATAPKPAQTPSPAIPPAATPGASMPKPQASPRPAGTPSGSAPAPVIRRPPAQPPAPIIRPNAVRPDPAHPATAPAADPQGTTPPAGARP